VKEKGSVPPLPPKAITPIVAKPGGIVPGTVSQPGVLTGFGNTEAKDPVIEGINRSPPAGVVPGVIPPPPFIPGTVHFDFKVNLQNYESLGVGFETEVLTKEEAEQAQRQAFDMLEYIASRSREFEATVIRSYYNRLGGDK
jgi:hypothetical protein